MANSKEENDEIERQRKSQMNENNRKTEKELKKKMDSLQSQLDKKDREKIAAAFEQKRKEEEQEERIRNANEVAKDKQKEVELNAADKERMTRIETRMKYDADAYLLALKRAEAAMENALKINPSAELKLKREWG